MAETDRPTKIRKLSHGQETTSLSHSTGVVSEPAGEGNARPHTAMQPQVDAHGPANGASTSIDGDSDPAPAKQTNGDPDAVPKLSKNAQKRLLKQQAWDAKLPQRLELRKQQRVAKRARKKEARNAAIASGEIVPGQQMPPSTHTQVPITFIIDCDFDDLMRDTERKSLGAQIQRCYADNKRAPYMNHLTIASFNGELKNRYDNVMRKHYESWKGVRFVSDDFLITAKHAEEWMQDPAGGELAAPVFAKYRESEDAIAQAKQDAEIVYLSSDSDYTLTELKPFSTYIIGGLVDKNREKGICHKRAVAKGVKTAQLPIGEYLEMASRKVLTTNHVHEIMLKWLELGDWGQAFMQVLPKRKEAKLRGANDEHGGDGNESETMDDAAAVAAEDAGL